MVTTGHDEGGESPPVGAPMRVSVIIPAYNYERYVGSAIESALAQTYPDVEVIVIDDGSTDGTQDVAVGFGDQITYVRKENAGLAAARNTGIETSTADAIVFLDADDTLEPHAVEKMVETARAHGGSWGVVACRFTVVNEAGEAEGTQKRAPEATIQIPWRSIVLRNRFCPIALVRREVFDRCGMFDTEFGTHRMGSEDRDMWIRAAAEFDVIMVGDRLARKRDHAVNMSSQTVTQMASMRHTLDKARRSGVVPSWNLPFWQKVKASYHYQGAHMFREAGDMKAAWKELLRSILSFPWFCDHREMGYLSFFRTRCLIHWLRQK